MSAAEVTALIAALDRIATALEDANDRDPFQGIAAAMAATDAATAQDGANAPITLPLPAPGYRIIYGPEIGGEGFFLLLEEPDGKRWPLWR